MSNEKLENALSFANYRQTLSNQKAKLQDQCEAQLNFAYNGGMFYITESLIGFVNSYVSDSKDSMCILDSNKTPIEITDLKDFQTKIQSRYFESVNEYFRSYQELSTKRKVKALVE